MFMINHLYNRPVNLFILSKKINKKVSINANRFTLNFHRLTSHHIPLNLLLFDHWNGIHRTKILASVLYTFYWYSVAFTALHLFDKTSFEMLSEFCNLSHHEFSFVGLYCLYAWPNANDFCWRWRIVNSWVCAEHSYFGAFVLYIFNRNRSVCINSESIEASFTFKRKENRYLDCFNVVARLLSIGKNTYIWIWPERGPSDIRYMQYF